MRNSFLHNALDHAFTSVRLQGLASFPQEIERFKRNLKTGRRYVPFGDDGIVEVILIVLWLPGNIDPAVLSRWFKTAGASLSELTLGDDLFFAHSTDLGEMVEAFAENCKKLRLLDVSCVFQADLARAFLCGTRGSLHHLVAHGTSFKGVSPVELYGTKLRTLVLNEAPLNLRDLLQVVGRTLEPIEIMDDIPLTGSEVDDIKDHCRKLSSIKLSMDFEDDWSDVKDLLCSYGSQLRYADRDNAPVAVWEQIVASCPNLRCDLTSRDNSMAQMNVVGACVKIILLDLDDLYADGIEMEEVVTKLRSCKQVERLHVYGVLSSLQALFSCDMPLLTSLSLHSWVESDLFLKLSLRAPNLRDLKCNVNAQERGAFDALVRNAPVLRNVAVYFEDREDWQDWPAYFARVEYAVIAFLKCTNLRSLISRIHCEAMLSSPM